MNTAQAKWPSRDDADSALVISRIPAELSFKSKAYAALKEAITNLDIYGASGPVIQAVDSHWLAGLGYRFESK